MASRSKKALLNTSCELLLEVITALCSFVLPRLILSHFGSTYNGITSSISQFIGCVALLKSGIGSVTRAALYKPLAKNDSRGISEIVNATSGFMKKVAVIFIVAVLAFSAIYPFIVADDFNWFFAFALVVIMSISTFAQYFFGLTYQMVLQADQRNYIISIVTIASTIINTAISSVLILMGFGIHIVKLGSAIVFVLPPIFYNLYVRKKYNLQKNVPANYELISERWDAFGHQVANFINQNTDIMVATIFLGVKEVSVYSIYYMVGHALQKVIKAFSTGTTAAFGNMIAKGEEQGLRRRFNQYEILMFFLSTVILTIAAVLITPFVSVYTKGVTDVNYFRPIFGYLICLAIYFTCIKLPYEQMVYAVGAFRDTRNGAFAEAGINIGISIILVNIIGLNGIVIGTIIAIAYRTLRYNFYVCSNVVKRSKISILYKISYSVVCVSISVFIARLFPLAEISDYVNWFIWACIVSLCIFMVCFVVGFLFFKEDMVGIFQILSKSLKRYKKH